VQPGYRPPKISFGFRSWFVGKIRRARVRCLFGRSRQFGHLQYDPASG
jgi:hypothetical protein